MPKGNVFDELNENLPVDVMPASNGEFYPLPPTADQKMIMRVQNEWIEEARASSGMSRRAFVRTAAAMAIGVMAVDAVNGARANADPLLPGTDYSEINKNLVDYCKAKPGTLDDGSMYKNAQLANLPGECIFDVQSHHVTSDGFWRITRPVHQAFILGFLNQGGPTSKDASAELDLAEGVGRAHYMKSMFLESSTTMTVLSPVPAAPDLDSPLPVYEAVRTAEITKELSGGTERTVIHAFVMPNLYSSLARPNGAGVMPAGFQSQMDWMWRLAEDPRVRHFLRGWKTYSPYADVPYAPAWQHHDDIGTAFAENVWKISQRYPEIRPTIATHKGPTLPGFHPTSNCAIDIGFAAKIALTSFPGLNYIVYHSGHDSGVGGGNAAAWSTYPTDKDVPTVSVVDYPNATEQTAVPDPIPYSDGIAPPTSNSSISVDSLVKSLRRTGLDGPHNKDNGALSHGNAPNVFGEIGATWRSVSSNRVNAATFLGKLIWHVGPRRVVWGTDSIWFGSPQDQIALLRTLQPTQLDPTASNTQGTGAIWAKYKLPYGLNGDRWDPQVNSVSGGDYRPSHVNAPINPDYPNAQGRVPGWPTDGQPHPERSIRNGIFGRNAADAYRIAPDQLNNAINCADVNRLRYQYAVNQYTDTARQSDPDRYLQSLPNSNAMHAPRTPLEVYRLRQREGWSP